MIMQFFFFSFDFSRLGVARADISAFVITWHLFYGSQSPLNAERQAGKLWMPFFKVLSMTQQGN